MMRLIALACAALMAAEPAAAAEPLGRLFFTPEQRVQLDVARSQKSRATLSAEKEEAAPAPEIVTYGGMVRRSDGRTTVWINHRAVPDQGPAAGTAITNRVRPDGGISLQVPQSGRSVDLKVGQSVELLSGTVEEGYARRLTAPKPEPKPAAKPEPQSAAKSAAGAAPPKPQTEQAGPRARRGRDESDEPAAVAAPAAAPPPVATPAAMPARGY